MMIEKIGAKNLKSSCRMMIEKVMIQIGVHFNRKGGGGGPRGTCDAEDAGSQLEKHQDAKSQSQKAAKSQKAKKPKSQKAKKPKSQKAKKPKSQKATCRSGTGNAEDAKREEL